MKTLFLTLILSLFAFGELAAQGCSTFECALQAAEKQLKSRKYELALTNLDDAEDFAANDNNKKNKVRALRKKIFQAIEQEKQRALDETVSTPSTKNLRSLMPVRSIIHSSVVSMILDKSSFVTTLSGT